MSGCVGGCLACVGLVRLFDVLSRTPNYLKRDIQLRENDTKCKQISRIVANVLRVIGLFCAAVGMITMGATLFALAPEIVFLTALHQAVFASLPYFIAALGALAGNLIIREIVR